MKRYFGKKRGEKPGDGVPGGRGQMPLSMFETRTDAWHKAGLGEQIKPAEMRTAWLRLILFSMLIAAVLVAFGNRRDLFPGFLSEARIITAILLFILGWGLASALGRELHDRGEPTQGVRDRMHRIERQIRSGRLREAERASQDVVRFLQQALGR